HPGEEADMAVGKAFQLAPMRQQTLPPLVHLGSFVHLETTRPNRLRSKMCNQRCDLRRRRQTDEERLCSIRVAAAECKFLATRRSVCPFSYREDYAVCGSTSSRFSPWSRWLSPLHSAWLFFPPVHRGVPLR